MCDLGRALARSCLRLGFLNFLNVTEIISDADYHFTTKERERVNSLPWPEVPSCARAGLESRTSQAKLCTSLHP